MSGLQSGMPFVQLFNASQLRSGRTEAAYARMQAHLRYVVWSIALEIYRPPDLQIGLSIQVGSLDEANLQKPQFGHNS